jgi:hypothetical protein
MITEELLDFIRTQLSAGETRESITTKLITEGNWSEEDANKAFSILSEGTTSTQQVPVSPPASNENKSFGASPQNAPAQLNKERRGTIRNKKTSPLLPLLVVVAFIMLGAVMFVIFGPFFGGRHSMAKDIDGFVKSYAQAMQDIEKFEYKVSLNMTQEPQDGSVEMLTITDPEHESLREAVERDIEVFNAANSLYNALRNTSYGNVGFPTSISEPAFLEKQSFYLERIESQNLEKLSYRQTEGGQNYLLTVQFETEEMLTYLKESSEKNSFGDEAEVVPVYDFDKLTMALERDARMPYYASVSQVLKKNPIGEALEMINISAQSLPSRFKGDVAFSGFVGIEQGKGEIPDTENVFAVNIDWGDLAFSVDAGLLIKDDEIFGKVERFPSVFFFDIEPIRGKWIRLSTEDLGSTMFWNVSDSEINDAQEELEKVPKMVAEAISEYNPFLFTKKPRVETMENGGSAVVYSLGINKDNVVGFLESLRTKLLTLSFIEEEENEFLAETEKLIAFFETEEFAKVVDYMNEYATFEVWMDERTGYPVQYVQEFVFVPNPDMLPENGFGFFGEQTAPKNTQLRTRSVTTLSNINKNIQIQKPSDSISIEEAMALITGQEYNEEEAKAKAEDVKVRSAVNNFRATAELYYDAKGSYSGVCSSSDSNSLATEIETIKEEAPTSDPQCFDSATAYAVEASLSDGSLYCVDSMGTVKDTYAGSSLAGNVSCF